MGEKTVKAKLLAGTLASFVLLALIVSINYFSFSNAESTILEQLKDKQLIATEYAARQIESHIYRTKDELTTLSKFPEMKTLDVSQCSGDMKIIHTSLETKINSLLRADKEGRITETSTPMYSDYLSLNIAEKDYFKMPGETREPFISNVMKQGSSQQIIISAPIFETTGYTPYPDFREEMKGVLLTVIEISSLYDLYIHPVIEPSKSEYVLFSNQKNEALLKSDGIPDYDSAENSLPEHSEGSYSGIAELYGERVIFTASHMIVGPDSWELMVITPVKNVSTGISKVQKRNLASLGIIVAVIITLLVSMLFLFRKKEEIRVKLDKASSTLEQFGIKSEIESGKYAQAEKELEPGKVYLVKDENDAQAFEYFIGTLNRGFAGLGFAREHPEKVRKKYGLSKTSLIWMTKNKAEGVPCASDISTIFSLIGEFMKKSRKSVILVERADYLIMEGGFEDFMKKLYEMKDAMHSSESIAIFSLNPSLVDAKQLKALETETEDIFGRHLKHTELSDIEIKILEFINERNKSNRLASFMDITKEFKITKPTTRAKIQRLQGLGLLVIEKRGRYKAIKITSAGRSLL